MFRQYRVILRELAFITSPSNVNTLIAAVVKTRAVISVVIYKFIVIVLLLVDLQSSKKMYGTCI
jgi:hypothetical protein